MSTIHSLPSDAQALPAEQTTRPNGARLWRLSLILTMIGIVISGYLTYTKLTGTSVACVKEIGNCDAVQASIYGYLGGYGGIPVAYVGLAGYLVIFGLLMLENRIRLLRRYGKIVLFVLTLGGFLFSAYLVTVSLFILHESCQWCLASAATMTTLFLISFFRVWQAIGAVPDEADAE
jgi:uncharacterized membrane protein